MDTKVLEINQGQLKSKASKTLALDLKDKKASNFFTTNISLLN